MSFPRKRKSIVWIPAFAGMTDIAMLTKKDPSVIQSYLEDSSNIKGGQAEGVFIPETAEEISLVLEKANSQKTPVTVSGAGTGQSGGRIPLGGIVLSLEKLNALKELKKKDTGGLAVAEAGVLIKDLKESSEKAGLFYTYDPTEGTAFLGGTIATNASGARSFRYGPTRKYVKALKIVLADGSIFTLRREEIRAKGRVLEFKAGHRHYKINLPTYKMPPTKNSAGYYSEDNMDLVDLFIGQEGTLSVIVEAELELVDKPKGIFSAFLFFKDAHEAFNFALDAKGARPLSIEYFDENCLKLLNEKDHNVPAGAKYAIFLEDEITEFEDAIMEKWEAILSGRGVSLDNTWASMNENMARSFLEKRHYIPEKMSEMAKHSGFPKVSTDLAVPGDKFAEMFRFYNDTLRENDLEYFVFGHIGDSHLHVNILARDEKDYKKAKALQLEFVKKSVSLGGTVSAEHGIGKSKKEFLKLLYGDKGVRQMLEVKKLLDPNLILGRGNIFDIF